MNPLDLPDNSGAPHLVSAAHILFLSAHGIFSVIDHYGGL